MRSCVSFLLRRMVDSLSPLAGRGSAAQRPVGEFGDRDAVGQFECRLEAVRQARRHVGPHHDAVHHHVDVVLVLLVELWRVGDLVELAVDLDALEPLLLQLGQLLAVLALAAADDGCQQVEARARRQGQHAVHHLLHGLALDGEPRGGRVGHAHAGEQEAQVVVDLGDGADGGARVLRRGLLLDGDGRGEPVDVVHIGLLHHLQELARIGRQAFHVTALALRVDGVEGQRRLAGARDAREHHQRVTRDLQVDVLEVVLARPADVDGLVGLGCASQLRCFAHDFPNSEMMAPVLSHGQPRLGSIGYAGRPRYRLHLPAVSHHTFVVGDTGPLRLVAHAAVAHASAMLYGFAGQIQAVAPDRTPLDEELRPVGRGDQLNCDMAAIEGVRKEVLRDRLPDQPERVDGPVEAAVTMPSERRRSKSLNPIPFP